MQRLTLCVIARNEEALLPGCLASVRGLADAIVVVDTGSTDRTAEIAREHGATVVEHAWQDDFADARNAALPHVPGGFVLVLDADERLGPGARSAIRKALRRDDFDCGLMPLHDAASLEATHEDVVAGRARRGEPVMLPRLLRRTPDLAWEGIVHEQVTAWALRQRRIVEIRAPIVHYGAVPSLREARAKNQRNLRLLERRVEREPANPVARAYLARELERSGDTARALQHAELAWSALADAAGAGRPEHDAILPATLLAFLHIRADNSARALEVLGQARAWSDAHPNVGLLEGWAHEKLAITCTELEAFAAHLEAARRSLSECIALAGRSFASECMPGASTFAGQTRLGTVLLLAGELEASQAAFRAALQANPDQLEARLGLVEALVDANRAAEALRELQPALRPELPDAWLLGAAAAQALGGATDACLFLDRAREALERQPWIAPHREARRIELETALRPSLVATARTGTASARTASVVIPCHNRFDLLRPVLEAFARESRDDEFELIAVDDGSSPPLAPLFASLGMPPTFRVVTRARNGGRGAALNSGLDHARGDVVILCDSDIVPAPGFVRDHLQFHRQSDDPRATALGALDWGVDAGLWGMWMGARSNPRLRNGTGEVGWTQWFTDNWSFRRELLAQGTLRFDETFRVWGWEELELAIRLLSRGARNLRIDAARGQHLKASTPEGMRASFARSVPNLLHLASRHPDRPEIGEWLSMRPSLETLERCEGLFERLWRRTCELDASGASIRDTGDPLVDWLALAFSDVAFRLGIGRGFAQVEAGASGEASAADRALETECAALAARLASLERALGRAEESMATLGLVASALPARDGSTALRDRVQWELRRSAPHTLATLP